MLPNSDVEADVALSRCAPSGPRSLTPVVMWTANVGRRLSFTMLVGASSRRRSRKGHTPRLDPLTKHSAVSAAPFERANRLARPEQQLPHQLL